MAAHVHAALMAEYAKDALETDSPWERWEFDEGHGWMSYTAEGPSWRPINRYRRKPVKRYLYGNFLLMGNIGDLRPTAHQRYSHERQVDSNVEYEFLDDKLVNVRLLT